MGQQLLDNGKTLALVSGILMLCMALAACPGDPDGGAADLGLDGSGPAQAAVIGRAGGTFVFHGKVTLEVPAGAVPRDTTITVTPTIDHPVDPRLVASTVYRFQPDGTRFLKPVKLLLLYQRSNIKQGTAEASLRIHKVVAGGWKLVQGGGVHRDHQTAWTHLGSFSKYGIMGNPPAGGDGHPVEAGAGPDGLFQPDLPQPDLPQPDLPQPDLPQPDLPQPDLPQSDLPQPDLPQPDLPQPDLPQPDLPVADAPWPDLPHPDTSLPDTGKPDALAHDGPSTVSNKWAITAGGKGQDWGSGIALDGAGNIYITGPYTNGASFGSVTLPYKSYSGDIYVAKYTPSGKLLWAVSAHASSLQSDKISVDAAGNATITGFFSGAASMGSTTLTASGGIGNQDIFVARLNPSGKFVWAASAGSPNLDHGYDVKMDAKGNTYVAGMFMQAATFGTLKLTATGWKEGFVAKLSPQGKFLWATGTGASNKSTVTEVRGIALDSSGNSFITGHHNGTVSFGSSTLTAAGKEDIFVARLNSSGTFLWAVVAGSNDMDMGLDVAASSNGDAVVSGYFYGTATFGSTTLTSKGLDLFVSRLNGAGKFLWTRSAGASGSSVHGYGIAVDNSGNATVTGWLTGNVSFGSLTAKAKWFSDIFVARLDNSGNWLWAVTAGGTDYDSGRDIALDSKGTSLVCGYYHGQADFEKTRFTSKGSADIFVARMDSTWSSTGPPACLSCCSKCDTKNTSCTNACWSSYYKDNKICDNDYWSCMASCGDAGMITCGNTCDFYYSGCKGVALNGLNLGCLPSCKSDRSSCVSACACSCP